MKKTIIKKSGGYTFVFIPTLIGRYKVSAQGFSSTWMQDNTSLTTAKNKMK